MRRSSRVLGATLVAAAVGTLTVVACFSDRSAPTEADTAQCAIPETADVDGSTIVFIRAFAFHPATVHVARGQRVTWVNCESTTDLSHTATADAGAWTSPLIAPATAFTVTMPAAGSFAYHCEPHPFMTGTVIVE